MYLLSKSNIAAYNSKQFLRRTCESLTRKQKHCIDPYTKGTHIIQPQEEILYFSNTLNPFYYGYTGVGHMVTNDIDNET